MQNPLRLLLGVSLLITSLVAAHAQTFSNGNFTTDSVLALTGSSSQELYGVGLAGNGGTTANGYTFLDSGTAVAQADITNVDAGAGYTGFLNGSPATSSGDTGFDGVLNSGHYGGAQTYTLNGLTGGLTYSLLIFTADNRTNGGFADFQITDGAAVSNVQHYFYSNGNGNGGVIGGYILETFTESGTGGNLSHSFTVSNPNSGIELEGILVGQEVPEPGTYALLGLGLAALVVVAKARRAASV